MVNSTCCGGQDRNTTVGPNQEMPPVETKNCYLSTGNGQSTFDYMNCGGADTACTDNINSPSSIRVNAGCINCKASSGGGYCDIGGEYYSSKGMGIRFHKLNNDEIAELSRADVSDGLSEINRLFERERRNMINRERQTEIRRSRRSSSSNTQEGTTTKEEETTTEEETTITDYITNILLYIGVTATFIVMILSIVLIILK